MSNCDENIVTEPDLETNNVIDTIDIEADNNNSLSKNQLKKQARHEHVLANKKLKRKSEQEKAREKFRLQREQGAPSKEELKKIQLSRLQEASETGLNVCVDFQFEDLMTDKELTHLANQAKRVYSSNKASSNPFNLHFINLSKDSKTYQRCCDKNDGFENYFLTVVEPDDIRDHFTDQRIVYLSPDSDNVLQDLDQHTVYIIGGLVDDSVKKNSSQQYCQRAEISTARLPIPEYMSRAESGGSYKQILTINQVFDILLTYHQHRDWRLALAEHVPQRTGFVIKQEDKTSDQ